MHEKIKAMFEQANELLAGLSKKMASAFDAMNADRDDVAAIVSRAMDNNPECSAEDLARCWREELDVPVEMKVIELALAMRSLLGPTWNVIYLHRYLLEKNDYFRGDESREELPMHGDDLEDIEEYWQRISDELDSKREEEKQMAQAWLKRQARKAA